MISLGHAKVLAGVERTELQLMVLDKILIGGYPSEVQKKKFSDLQKRKK